LVVVTLFPGLIEGYLSQGIVGRAAARGLFTTTLVDPRAFTEDRHRTVDDVPFGGGAGMVMKPDPLARSLRTMWDHPPWCEVINSMTQKSVLTCFLYRA
jgi:tRNA (guanine37-N1)-methyltransferase